MVSNVSDYKFYKPLEVTIEQRGRQPLYVHMYVAVELIALSSLLVKLYWIALLRTKFQLTQITYLLQLSPMQ